VLASDSHAVPCGLQSWFDATVRTDVNDGINTREKLKRHDPGLARMLEQVRVEQSFVAQIYGLQHTCDMVTTD
jgi:hypothetical protein